MSTDMNIHTVSDHKFNLFSRQIWVLNNTVTLLAFAAVFSQKDYDSFYAEPVFIAAFMLTIAYFIFRICRDKGLRSFFMERFREYSKTNTARFISLMAIILVVMRFILPDEIVHYMQIILYVAAGISLVAGSLYLVFRR